MTKKQRKETSRERERAEGRNKELTEEDVAKSLNLMVGKQVDKRFTKRQEREGLCSTARNQRNGTKDRGKKSRNLGQIWKETQQRKKQRGEMEQQLRREEQQEIGGATDKRNEQPRE
jgi:hypothetical protein